jgi:ABC-2 type transport system ATP-binding protein
MSDQQREFWSAVAEKYDRVVDLQIGGQTRSMVRARLDKESALGGAVEFGCGTGFFTATLASKAARLLATDLSPSMVELTRQRTAAANVTFLPQDCQRTSFAAGSFDTAFIGLVIHFTEPAATLKEIQRILRPGGMVIIASVNANALVGFDRMRAFARMLYWGVVVYRTRPPKRFGRNMLGKDQLCNLLQNSGFEVVSAETVKDASRSSNIPIDYLKARKP